MKLFWEYTFPLDEGSIFRIALQKGMSGLLGVAVAQQAKASQPIHTIHLAFFEIDLNKKYVLHSSKTMDSAFTTKLQIIYDKERTRWLLALDRTLYACCVLEVYEIHSEADAQWMKRISIKGERGHWMLGYMRCHALWKTGQRGVCAFNMRMRIGETSRSHLFWTDWTLQNGDWNEDLYRIEKGYVVTTYVREQRCLLFLREQVLDQHRPLKEMWRLNCIAYEIDEEGWHQEIIPQLTTPIRSKQDSDEDVLQEIGVASGPLYGDDQQLTCVLAEETHTKSERPQVITSHLFWLDLQGHVLESLDAPLGRHLTLCCCGEKVIGTDLLEGQWRRWHWVPSAGTGIQVDAYLPGEVTQSIVVAEEPHPDQETSHYWCIEGYELGVRVSQRECEGGNELMVVWCEDFVLLSDWAKTPTIKNHQLAVASDGCLVLLGVNEDEKLKLVCFQ